MLEYFSSILRCVKKCVQILQTSTGLLFGRLLGHWVQSLPGVSAGCQATRE